MISSRWKGDKSEAEVGSRMGGRSVGGWSIRCIVHLPLGAMRVARKECCTICADALM
jgi:hypothetical protein